MARSVSTPNDQAATLRNLKVLVVLLVLSNILVGLLGVYLLRAVDKRYSELVGRSVPVLNDLRELMTDTVAAMRATNPRNFSGPDSNEPAVVEAMKTSLQKAVKFRDDLLENGSLKEELTDQEALRKTGAAFAASVTEVMQIYSTGRRADGVRMREEKLLPSFDQHMAAIGRAADAVEANSLGISRDYTSRTNSLSTIVLGVASWPVIVLFGLLLLTAVFVIAMMIAFRGKDLADMP
jgi:hypothetical protein